MAKLIQFDDDRGHSSEIEVARKLRDELPDDWVVYHSYPWLRPTRDDASGPLREGESDFVIVDPQKGFLVLEVKGGEVIYDRDERAFFRLPARKKITNPFVQGEKGMRTILNDAKKYGVKGDEFSGKYGYAAIFPHCEWIGDPALQTHSQNTLDERDMPALGSRVRTVMQSFFGDHVEVEPRDMDSVRRALEPRFTLKYSLGRRVQADENLLIRLTSEQHRTLASLNDPEQPRIRVRGGAGSGKTLLALQKARNSAASGRKTLFICYNVQLAEWGRASYGEPGDNLTILHFHDLCRQLARTTKTKIPRKPAGDTSHYWSQTKCSQGT